MTDTFFQTGHGRVFLQKFGAGPGRNMSYMGRASLGGFSKSDGDVTPARNPSPHAYDQFEDVAEVRGEEGRPTTSLKGRFGLENEIISMVCPFHIQAHYGQCADPQDANGGWEKILAYDHCYFTARSSDDLTALDSGERAMIMLTGEITARKMWEVNQMNLGEVADAEVTREVADVMVADYISCGDCGYESDGDQRIFAVASGPGAESPTISPILLQSSDGGTTWATYDITTMTDTDAPTAVAISGGRAIVTVNDTPGVHVADLNALDTWMVSTAVFATGVNDIYSPSGAHAWMVGDGGYIWFSSRPANEAIVQESGSTTSENLLAIHGVDNRNLVAVGENGAILVTTNGGRTWQTSPTAPALVGDIHTVWMRTAYTWLIGDDDGNLFYTTNAGGSWHALDFPLSGEGRISDIAFAHYVDSPFGFLVANDATGKGYIFRTLDGGDTWYQLPDFANLTPTNVGLNAVAAGLSANFCVAGGLKELAGDGIIIIGS